MPEARGLLVLGLGNLLLGDDGLGPAAVMQLQRKFEIPPEVRVVDGGTLGLVLLGLISEAAHVILVDAIRTDAATGSLVRIEGDAVAPAVRERLSPHQVGVADLLEAARLTECYPSTVTLLGLVPANLELTLERSDPVKAGMNELVEAIVHEASVCGYQLVRRPNADHYVGFAGAADDRGL